MSNTIITQQPNTQESAPIELTRREFLATIAIPFLTRELSQARTELAALTPAEPAPIETYHRAIDNAIDQLLAWKADLIRAQLAGVKTVDLPDPNNDKIHTVALELAIDAVEFLCNVQKGGAG